MKRRKGKHKREERIPESKDGGGEPNADASVFGDIKSSSVPTPMLSAKPETNTSLQVSTTQLQ